MILILVGLSVALVSFIVYALERRSKAEPIVWEDALKLSLFGGLVSSGVVFASTTDTTVSIVKDAVVEVPGTVANVAQEMFVGTPAF